jgi:SagB-type dehydrogenase family enzyme
MPLAAVLERRRSVRAFGPDPVGLTDVAQLLWAAQGITVAWGGRTAPSAGERYPLELQAVTAERVLRYVPDGHRAEVTEPGDLRPQIREAALGQEPIGAAPLIVAVSVVPARTAERYGDRAGRYADLEAGHATQNLLLQAVALDLGAVPIGAFDDGAVQELLAMADGQHPRYLVAVGHPEPDDA